MPSVHGISHVCTDHYNDVFSYLIHVVCRIAKDQPSGREGCVELLNSVLVEGGMLDGGMVKELYPDVFSE